ncbi:hypothetical protein CUC08_Gglean008343 [Alternaria sp. MG1]|nr:hypothetical protein AALT_g5464 [Alternaria alternata]RII07375.1 hypothetical protein CUC08_Gglean008343 [Alternaria sp. MG1]RYN84914.1 hypothetical protein AA0120_g9146 [Alternaria tenuissima]
MYSPTVPERIQYYDRSIMLMDRLAAISQRNHRRCPLLRLPAELRNKIYEYVFLSHPVRPFREHREWPHWAYPRSQLNLLETCRQIYFEAKLFPFALNVFVGYAEHVIELLLTTFTASQTNTISTVRLYVDAFGVYRDGKLPEIGLNAWFIEELGDMCQLVSLSEVTLIWFGSDIEVVREHLEMAVLTIFKEAGRADIKISVRYFD